LLVGAQGIEGVAEFLIAVDLSHDLVPRTGWCEIGQRCRALARVVI
jgi:hypothetical protein